MWRITRGILSLLIFTLESSTSGFEAITVGETPDREIRVIRVFCKAEPVSKNSLALFLASLRRHLEIPGLVLLDHGDAHNGQCQRQQQH